MAKKTKGSNLSIEERLEQALIPNWDEPYKLPENWCWTHIEYCCREYFSGKSPKYSKTDTGYHIIGQQANQRYGLDLNFIKFATNEFAESQDSRYWLQKKDVILNTLGAGSIGRSGIIKNNVNLLTDGHLFVFRTNQWVVPEYLYYFLQLTEESIIASANGSTNQKFLSLSAFSQTAIPLSPLAEQQRIVAHIEALFEKLGEAKEKAQEVVDGFETRKAAILHKAFSGELTAKWREENGIDVASYDKRRFDEVAIIKSNLVDPAEYQDYPHIAPDNIEKKTGVLLEYYTIAEDGVKSGKHRFYPGQILYSKIRPNLSKVVIVDFDGLCSADMYPIEALGDARCLWYYMLSEIFLEQASSAGSRSVLPKINQKELSALTVTIPDSIEEQKELAKIIDSLFTKEYQVKEFAQVVIDQIETMKKAILARAFRGELGTNDPNEESAVELLKRVLESK